MQHDVTAVLTVYTAVTVITINVMVSVSSVGFLFTADGVVSTECLQYVGTLYNYVYTFQQ